MRICLFEDPGADKLSPLSLTRPVFDLRCGHMSLRERIVGIAPQAGVSVIVRDYLAEVYKQKRPDLSVNDLDALKADDCLFVNGRLLNRSGTPLSAEGTEEVAKAGDDIVYVRATSARLASLKAQSVHDVVAELADSLPVRDVEATMIEYPWNLVHHNPDMLVEDFRAKGDSGLHGDVSDRVVVLGSQEDVFVAPGAHIHPFVELDASEGPIYIDRDVVVHPFTRVEGPSYVGPKCWLLAAKLREGCSLGPVCRVGGEVEESIIHGYSSKYHDGFLGHAYVGEWVNLGALTTNSDLKNDYSTVSLYVGGESVDSGDLKVGAFIGDHTKTGLATLFNTGTIVGVMCNILPAGELLPRYIPSFSATFGGTLSRGLGLKKLLATARHAVQRRKVALTDADVAMFEHIYEATDPERRELIKKARRKK